MLLRQTHPQPRLTIPLADDKLADQVTEMQNLSDQVQATKQKGKAVKARVKSGALEVENLRVEAAEAEKAVKASQIDEDDSRLVPLCDWSVFRRVLYVHTNFFSVGSPPPWPCNIQYPILKSRISRPRMSCG
jgi:hypothetical protein